MFGFRCYVDSFIDSNAMSSFSCPFPNFIWGCAFLCVRMICPGLSRVVYFIFSGISALWTVTKLLSCLYLFFWYQCLAPFLLSSSHLPKSLLSVSVSVIGDSLKDPLTYSFRTLSKCVTPTTQRGIFNSAVEPYSMVCLMTVFYTLLLVLIGILLSHITPDKDHNLTNPNLHHV